MVPSYPSGQQQWPGRPISFQRSSSSLPSVIGSAILACYLLAERSSDMSSLTYFYFSSALNEWKVKNRTSELAPPLASWQKTWDEPVINVTDEDALSATQTQVVVPAFFCGCGTTFWSIFLAPLLVRGWTIHLCTLPLLYVQERHFVSHTLACVVDQSLRTVDIVSAAEVCGKTIPPQVH